MILRRLGRDDDAMAVLDAITTNMDIIENTAYYRLCLFYKGELEESDLVGSEQGPANAAVAYGIANWHLAEGDTEGGTRRLEEIVAGDGWAAFGYIAAEADLARIRNSELGISVAACPQITQINADPSHRRTTEAQRTRSSTEIAGSFGFIERETLTELEFSILNFEFSIFIAPPHHRKQRKGAKAQRRKGVQFFFDPDATKTRWALSCTEMAQKILCGEARPPKPTRQGSTQPTTIPAAIDAMGQKTLRVPLVFFVPSWLRRIDDPTLICGPFRARCDEIPNS